MITRAVSLDHLRQIEHESGGRITITVDAVRRIAYLRRGRVRYVAPLAEERAS